MGSRTRMPVLCTLMCHGRLGRAKQKIFRFIRKILSILSFLLVFSFTLLWIRSYWYLDEISCNYQKLAPQNHHLINVCSFTSTTGTLIIHVANIDIDLKRPDPV